MAGPQRYEAHTGQVSDPSSPQAKEKPAYQGGPSTFDSDKQGRSRVVIGEGVEALAPQQYDVVADRGEGRSFLETGRSQTGVPKDRSSLTEDDLVMHEGVQTRIKELLALGIVRKGADGLQEVPQSEQPKPKHDEYQPVPFTGDTESSIRSASSVLGGETILSLATTLATDGEVKNLGDLASRLHVEHGALSAEVARVENEVRGHADRALAQVGVSDPAAFVAWVRANHDGDFLDSVAALVAKGDVRPLQKLGQAYAVDPVAQKQQAAGDAGTLSDNETAKVFTALQNSPIPTYQKPDGTIMVWPDGATDWTPLSEARRRGLIRISAR